MQPQPQLLRQMIESKIDARIIKVCAMGLTKQMLAQSIYNLEKQFLVLEKQIGFNVCGEGGEYESIVLDCPLFKKKLEIVDIHIIDLGNDYNVCSYVVIDDLIAVEKTESELAADQQILDQIRITAPSVAVIQ